MISVLAIKWSRRAARFVEKAPLEVARRVLDAADRLLVDPVPHDAKRVQGARRAFRIRVGDYRIIYELNPERKEVLILDVDKRSRVYD